MKSDNLLDIPDPDAPVYRIYPLHRFLDVLRSRKNALVKPTMWDDPFENFFLRAPVEEPNGEKISISSVADDWYRSRNLLSIRCQNSEYVLREVSWCPDANVSAATQHKRSSKPLGRCFAKKRGQSACSGKNVSVEEGRAPIGAA